MVMYTRYPVSELFSPGALRPAHGFIGLYYILNIGVF